MTGSQLWIALSTFGRRDSIIAAFSTSQKAAARLQLREVTADPGVGLEWTGPTLCRPSPLKFPVAAHFLSARATRREWRAISTTLLRRAPTSAMLSVRVRDHQPHG